MNKHNTDICEENIQKKWLSTRGNIIHISVFILITVLLHLIVFQPVLVKTDGFFLSLKLTDEDQVDGLQDHMLCQWLSMVVLRHGHRDGWKFLLLLNGKRHRLFWQQLLTCLHPIELITIGMSSRIIGQDFDLMYSVHLETLISNWISATSITQAIRKQTVGQLVVTVSLESEGIARRVSPLIYNICYL